MKWFLIVLLALSVAAGCRTNVSPDQQARDLQTTAEVKSKLAAELGVQTVTNIDVNTTGGVVTLAGSVNSAEAKDRATAIAQSVPDVSSVVNSLQVAGG